MSERETHLDSDGIERTPNEWGFNSFATAEGAKRSVASLGRNVRPHGHPGPAHSWSPGGTGRGHRASGAAVPAQGDQPGHQRSSAGGRIGTMSTPALSVDESLRLMAETYVTVNGAMLRQCRRKRHLSQAELARAAGTAQSNIARLEGGGCKTRSSVVRHLAEALDVRVQVLVRLPPRVPPGITREAEDA
jgi:DNA-binding XRE family transcriptional regulator